MASPAISGENEINRRILSGSEVLPALLNIRSSTIVGLPEPFAVAPGQVRIFDKGAILAAEEIILGPGSTLILYNPSISQSQASKELFIVAKKLTLLPGKPAPVITWNRQDAPSLIPPPVGKAPAGLPGESEGASGGKGSNGATGNPGFPGRSAPTLYITIDQIMAPPDSQLIIDFRGQDGGPGGNGQDGGDGGRGARGTPGSSSLFDCKRGGGDGGSGGEGGNGGAGGLGGRAGDGGNVIFMGRPEIITETSKIIVANVSSGMPGLGGRGGKGGTQGQGGDGGSAAPPFCGGGKPGPSGKGGTNGTDRSNERGPIGVEGVVANVPLNENNLSGIGLREK